MRDIIEGFHIQINNYQMKSMYVLIGILLIRATLFSQGIRFEEDLSWSQVRRKSKG